LYSKSRHSSIDTALFKMLPKTSLAFIAINLLLGYYSQLTKGDYVPPEHSQVRDAKDEPALTEMAYDLGYGREYFMAYVQPNISSFTQDEHQSVVKPRHNGHAAKFINMGPTSVRLYWVGGGGVPHYMNNCKEFGTTGTGE